jgi:heat-inducible transcriptional repressor
MPSDGALTPSKAARGITKALSSITHFTGFAIRKPSSEAQIKDIRFIPVDKRSLLVVIVSKNSNIKTHLARMDEGLLKEINIEAASNYLNSIGRGLTLSELRDKVIIEMTQEKNLYDKLLSKALRLGEIATRELRMIDEADLYLDGETTIFDQAEFKENNERLRRVFKCLLEEKEVLVKILCQAVKNDKVSIHIGSECAPEEFAGLSFVSSTYSLDGLAVGTIGIIGPVRMDYSRIIPLVDYSALKLGHALQ